MRAGSTPLGTVQDLGVRHPGKPNHLHLEARHSSEPGKIRHTIDEYKNQYRLLDPRVKVPGP